jgi:hypothetical protein
MFPECFLNDPWMCMSTPAASSSRTWRKSGGTECSLNVMNVDPTPTREVRVGESIVQITGKRPTQLLFNMCSGLVQLYIRIVQYSTIQWLRTTSLCMTYWLTFYCSNITLNVHWICTKYALNMHWMCTECAQNVHWMFPECSLNVHWMCTEYALNVHWMCTECALNVHWMCTECALNVH